MKSLRERFELKISEKKFLMKKLRLKSESGFTLIELLVVVAIIGILARSPSHSLLLTENVVMRRRLSLI